MLKLALATALAVMASPSAFAQGLSTQQLQSVFGSATDLQGDSVSLPQFQFTVVTNSTHALMSMNSTSPPSRVGWMGVGAGSRMANADFLVAWPNPDGFSGPAASPWTLSHRRPTSGDGEGQPIATAGSTANYYTFLPELSSTSTSPFTVVTFIRPLTMPSGYPTTLSSASVANLNRAATTFVYASSSASPGSADETATITQHNQAHATTSLQLSTTVNLAGTATGGNGTSSTSPVAGTGSENAGGAGAQGGRSGGRTKRDMILIAHAVCGSLALVIFAPAAILIARFLRGSTWYPAHSALNGLAALLVIACFALGTYSADAQFDDTHHFEGLAVFIIILLQVALGAFAHTRQVHPSPAGRLPTLSKKSPFRLVHIVLGVALIALGWVTINEGFQEWEESSSAQTSVPKAVKIVFYVVIAATAALYVVGWGLEALGRNRTISRTDDGRKHVEKVSEY